MTSIKISFLAMVILGLTVLSGSNAYGQSNCREKKILIVYVLSASNTLKFHYSINGQEYKEEEIKRDERRNFNSIIEFLQKKYSEGWTLKSSNMATGASYEEFYYMLEK